MNNPFDSDPNNFFQQNDLFAQDQNASATYLFNLQSNEVGLDGSQDLFNLQSFDIKAIHNEVNLDGSHSMHIEFKSGEENNQWDGGNGFGGFNEM